MKTIIKDKTNPKPELKYPVLMKSQIGSIVLFTSKCSGIVIAHQTRDAGKYFTDWYEGDFRPFEGSVTLSND